jgi:uncharacterized protein (DUF1778 family)
MTGKKKPARLRKDERVLLRVTATQKSVLQKAAEASGLTLSSWMLSVALREATASAKR